jgi:hypothetical protein
VAQLSRRRPPLLGERNHGVLEHVYRHDPSAKISEGCTVSHGRPLPDVDHSTHAVVLDDVAKLHLARRHLAAARFILLRREGVAIDDRAGGLLRPDVQHELRSLDELETGEGLWLVEQLVRRHVANPVVLPPGGLHPRRCQSTSTPATSASDLMGRLTRLAAGRKQERPRVRRVGHA